MNLFGTEKNIGRPCCLPALIGWKVWQIYTAERLLKKLIYMICVIEMLYNTMRLCVNRNNLSVQYMFNNPLLI